MKAWGVKHRIFSTYFPHSNTRAELGVKAMKRLMWNNSGPRGDLDNDAFARALLMYRNTPMQGVGVGVVSSSKPGWESWQEVVKVSNCS